MRLRMLAEDCYDLSPNNLRHTNGELRTTTTEEPSIAAYQQDELSAEMMKLLSDALDDFDEPCSRVGLVHGTDKSRLTLIDQQRMSNNPVTPVTCGSRETDAPVHTQSNNQQGERDASSDQQPDEIEHGVNQSRRASETANAGVTPSGNDTYNDAETTYKPGGASETAGAGNTKIILHTGKSLKGKADLATGGAVRFAAFSFPGRPPGFNIMCPPYVARRACV